MMSEGSKVSMGQQDIINPIGGYFELELPQFSEYHAKALALNSGRFCLEYILRCRCYKKVYVPYFTCDSAIEPIIKLGIPYEFYHIGKDYNLIDDIRLSDDEAIMYTNYWGVHDANCIKMAERYGKQLILDYTQAFFSKPISGIDTFYSCRKFFGVPDGGYLYTDVNVDFNLKQDESYTRMNSLLKRIDISPEAGYDDFRRASATFHTSSIGLMSKLTKRIMQGIDYAGIAKRRVDNYNFLCENIGGHPVEKDEVPMVFPFIFEGGQMLRKRLIENKVFVAKYWPNVDEWAGKEALETWMANNILPLPIDQRYCKEDMIRIVNLVNHGCKY